MINFKIDVLLIIFASTISKRSSKVNKDCFQVKICVSNNRCIYFLSNEPRISLGNDASKSVAIFIFPFSTAAGFPALRSLLLPRLSNGIY